MNKKTKLNATAYLLRSRFLRAEYTVRTGKIPTSAEEVQAWAKGLPPEAFHAILQRYQEWRRNNELARKAAKKFLNITVNRTGLGHLAHLSK